MPDPMPVDMWASRLRDCEAAVGRVLLPMTAAHQARESMPPASAHDKILTVRFRQSGDATDCAPGARGGRLFRDRAVPEGGSGLRRDEAESGDPLRRPGIG